MSIQWDPQVAKCFWLGKQTNSTWYDFALYNDGGSGITALTLDMSGAGAATINDAVTLSLIHN